MTGPTHRQYSITFAYLATIFLCSHSVTGVNYYLCLIIMLMVSKAGALFPDIDHSWQNVKNKTTLTWIINKLIHLTGGKHRSWQTHSIDIVVICTIASYYTPKIMYSYGYISDVDTEILSLILFGFMCGWISHIVADMLTSAGVRIICWMPTKVALVPKKIFKLRFNTGNEWEAFCYKSTRVINVALGLFAVCYPIIKSGILTKLL